MATDFLDGEKQGTHTRESLRKICVKVGENFNGSINRGIWESGSKGFSMARAE